MASVEWTPRALQDLVKIDRIIGRRIVAKVIWLGENIAHVMPERLHREFNSSYKLRIGDYRAIYSVNQDTITIQKVGHRRDVYK